MCRQILYLIMFKCSSPGEVLLLHKVTSKKEDQGPYSDMIVSPGQLDEYLKNRSHYKKIRSVDHVPMTSEVPWLMVTFDDGYRDNLLEALPILEKHNTPAVVFVTVGFIDKELEPFSAWVASILNKAPTPIFRGKLLETINSKNFTVILNSVYRHMDRGMLSSRFNEFHKFSSENGLQPEFRGDMFLSWQELRKLSSHPLITLGAHSWSHPRLTRIPIWELYKELYLSKKRIEDETGVKVDMLSYPHGANNFFIRLAARFSGYRHSFTTVNKNILPFDFVNPHGIPRVSLSDY